MWLDFVLTVMNLVLYQHGISKTILHAYLLLNEADYVTRYGDELWTGDHGSILGKRKKCLCTPLRLGQNWDPSSLMYNGHQVLYPWGGETAVAWSRLLAFI